MLDSTNHMLSCPVLCMVKLNGGTSTSLIGNKKGGSLGVPNSGLNDPWIPTAYVWPTRPAALMMHPRMIVSDHTHGNPRRCNVGLLEQLVAQEDVSLIRSMAISQSHREDRYSWGYTKSGLYNVKS